MALEPSREGADVEERTLGYCHHLARMPQVLAPGRVWKPQSFWGLLGAYRGAGCYVGESVLGSAWAEVTSEEGACWSQHSKAAW